MDPDKFIEYFAKEIPDGELPSSADAHSPSRLAASRSGSSPVPIARLTQFSKPGCHVSHLVHIDKDTVAVSGYHESFPTLLLSSYGRAQGLGGVELSLIYFAILDCVIDEKIGQR